jgi:hypothetical protein
LRSSSWVMIVAVIFIVVICIKARRCRAVRS